MRNLFLSALLTALCALPGVGFAADTIALADTTPYGESGTPDNVRNECELHSKLPEYVKTYAKKAKIDLVLQPGEPDTRSGRVLVLKIIGTEGVGGGAWSGAKAVKVTGELYENGKVVGSFYARRHSGGGAFGGYKGTCSIMGRCVKAIGKDVSGWLKKPTMDARLGNL